MTDTVVLALIAGVAPTLTALAGIIVSIRNGRKTDAVGVQATAAATQADVAAATSVNLVDGQKEIHSLVNGNLSKLKADLAEAKIEIEVLRGLVASLTQRFERRALSPSELAAVAPPTLR